MHLAALHVLLIIIEFSRHNCAHTHWFVVEKEYLMLALNSTTRMIIIQLFLSNSPPVGKA